MAGGPRAKVQVEIFAAKPEDAPTLANLLQLYLHDFTDFAEWDVDASGRFSEDDLHGCWTDPRRHPFLLVVDGHLAGFAIVDRGSAVREDPDVTDMAEFFVMRRYRRHGVGREVARRLFGQFPGRWEVRQMRGNAGARAFWRRIIGEYCDGAYTESIGRFGGTMQSFVAPTP